MLLPQVAEVVALAAEAVAAVAAEAGASRLALERLPGLVLQLVRRPSYPVRCDCTRVGLLWILTGLPQRVPDVLALGRGCLLPVRPQESRVPPAAELLPLPAVEGLF